MAIATSRVTAQGQISVPAAVRRKLGIGPGSVLEWNEDDAKTIQAFVASTYGLRAVSTPEGKETECL